MDDSIGTIFYIIISIVIIAVSALGRKKKPQQKTATGSGVLDGLAREFNFFETTGDQDEYHPEEGGSYNREVEVSAVEDEEIFSGLYEEGGPAVTDYPREEAIKPAVTSRTLSGGEKDMPSPEQHLLFKGETEEEGPGEGERIFSNEFFDHLRETEIRDIREDEISDHSQGIMDEFDLRKAVVFSEILGTKYV